MASFELTGGYLSPSFEGVLMDMSAKGDHHTLAYSVEPSVQLLNSDIDARTLTDGRIAIEAPAVWSIGRGVMDLAQIDNDFTPEERRALISGCIISCYAFSSPGHRVYSVIRGMNPKITRDITPASYKLAKDESKRSSRRSELRLFPPIERFTGKLDIGINDVFPHNKFPKIAEAALIGAYVPLLNLASYSNEEFNRGNSNILADSPANLRDSYTFIAIGDLAERADQASSLAKNMPSAGGLAGFIKDQLAEDFLAISSFSSDLYKKLNQSAQDISDYERVKDIMAGCDSVLIAHLLIPETRDTLADMNYDELSKYLREALEIASSEKSKNNFLRELEQKGITHLWELYLELGMQVRQEIMRDEELYDYDDASEHLPQNLPDNLREPIVAKRLGNLIAIIAMHKHTQASKDK